ncbi:hypothetical protein LHW04_26750 [Bacillus tropicus]|nr:MULTISPECIES: hypothetical protein [Bacillus cereus group]MCB4848659.1 hypothetical protein [Bacillus tropicus]
MENKNNSFVVTVTPITENSDLTTNTEVENELTAEQKMKFKLLIGI